MRRKATPVMRSIIRFLDCDLVRGKEPKTLGPVRLDPKDLVAPFANTGLYLNFVSHLERTVFHRLASAIFARKEGLFQSAFAIVECLFLRSSDQGAFAACR